MLFAQFLAQEKRNLRCFPSFEKTNTAKTKRWNYNHLDKNDHPLSYNLSNAAYDEATVTIIPALQMNETQSISNNSMQKTQSIIDTSGEKCMHCVEHNIGYINDSQTKAAICLVRQLNMYMNQNDLRSKKMTTHKEDLVDSDGSSTRVMDLAMKSKSNDSIDVLAQSSSDYYPLPKAVTPKHDHLFSYYNRTNWMSKFPEIIGSKRSQDPLNINEIDINNSSHSSCGNLQMSIYKHTAKMSGDTYFYNLPTTENKTFTNAWARVSVENRDFAENVLFRLDDKRSADTSIANRESATDAVSVSSRPIKESLKLMEITEKPTSSCCMVAFECENGEAHVFESARLSRSSHRAARVNVYNQIYNRLAISNSIDFDLSALIRTVVQNVA
ncbi:unnamed protein product [Adineta ricciae]|uniref:Uncharacterized protein n=1 Tax=Adineta ricciae TaxID=249248 RepID=A0A814DTF4_ADIRI|nr:unnamed protein product [Adineta ricciae]